MEITTVGSTVVLTGDFDVRSTAAVRSALDDALAAADHDIVVDLSGVRAVDHTALRVLAYASRRARMAGHHLILCGCRPAVRRMLHLTHLRRAVQLAGETDRGVSPITHRRAVTTG